MRPREEDFAMAGYKTRQALAGLECCHVLPQWLTPFQWPNHQNLETSMLFGIELSWMMSLEWQIWKRCGRRDQDGQMQQIGSISKLTGAESQWRLEYPKMQWQAHLFDSNGSKWGTHQVAPACPMHGCGQGEHPWMVELLGMHWICERVHGYTRMDHTPTRQKRLDSSLKLSRGNALNWSHRQPIKNHCPISKCWEFIVIQCTDGFGLRKGKEQTKPH